MPLWNQITPSPVNKPLRSVAYSGTNTWWAVTENSIIASTDDGVSWGMQQDYSAHKMYDFQRIRFTNADNGWIVGN